ncbi:helix-turn-helix domain-containing protein [Flexithrix dorotheae]|uniref:helix-turn-helix domain-containing protein n=1 Tax=Flexithrix dorotheae TaxID=70993 RepID=UPI0003735DAC|nr:helix-turn-helix transcriptional regulator [Flexithrix dorotheae]
MNKKVSPPLVIESIPKLHKHFGIKSPEHPLVSVVDLKDVPPCCGISDEAISHHFYTISIKKNVKGKFRYGQQYYDFDKGVMTFLAPKQILKIELENDSVGEGFMLYVHPDFFQKYPLAAKIKEYGFFSYAVNEALHLSETEDKMISKMFMDIRHEIHTSIDNFTQDLIVSYIDLLLNYSNRFYNRQFITRKVVNNDILVKLENLLHAYFNQNEFPEKGLPTVQYISEKLNISPSYLSDMLRHQTGMSTKHHIQNVLIEKAKEFLSITDLSISEIAYMLGFEYPQSFNKLFKNKTNQTPLQYRHSLN